MKKLITFGVILLFLGVTIAPSINFTVVKASTNNDLVEVTTQACGINGTGKTTVRLTQQQYQTFHQNLVDFRNSLNTTTSKRELVTLYQDFAGELDQLGLLPKGMSLKQAQMLFSEENAGRRSYLITGQINGTIVLTALTVCTTIAVIALFFCLYPLWFFFPKLEYRLFANIARSYFKENTSTGIISVGSVIGMQDYPNEYTPSQGWVQVNGTLNQRWEGDLYGTLGLFPIASGWEGYYTGIVGFKGIKIFYSEDDVFLMGRAREVGISNSPPGK